MPFSIERNDLARMQVDAVVVAANEQLRITGGVGAAVARAAGAARMQEACDAIGFCPTGSAAVTPGFDLPARFVIHAVGPVWIDGSAEERRLLASAYRRALACAAESGAQSVALPLLSAGTYGCPADISFALAREAVQAFLEQHDADVRIVLYDRAAVVAGLAAYGDIASYIDDRYVDEHAPIPNEAQRRREEAAAFSGRPQHAAAYSPDPLPRPPTASMASMPSMASTAAPPLEKHRKRDGILGRLSGLRESLRREPKEESAEYGAAPMHGAEPLYPAPPSASASMPTSPSAASTGALPCLEEAAPVCTQAIPTSLDDLLDSMDEPFSTTLLALIDARGLTDAQVYKRANMSRQLFSKIRSDAWYRPAKKTVLALAVALRLDLAETEDLLRRAGFALSRSSKADIIVEYFIARRQWDIFAINEALYAFDQPLL